MLLFINSCTNTNTRPVGCPLSKYKHRLVTWCGVVSGVVTWCHHHHLLFVCHLNNTWRQFSATTTIIFYRQQKTQRKKFLRWFTFYMRFSNIVNICLVHCVFSNWICEINVFIINLLYKDSDWITNTWSGIKPWLSWLLRNNSEMSDCLLGRV